MNRNQAIYLKAINDTSHGCDSYRSEAVKKHVKFLMALRGRILPIKYINLSLKSFPNKNDSNYCLLACHQQTVNLLWHVHIRRVWYMGDTGCVSL